MAIPASVDRNGEETRSNDSSTQLFGGDGLTENRDKKTVVSESILEVNRKEGSSNFDSSRKKEMVRSSNDTPGGHKRLKKSNKDTDTQVDKDMDKQIDKSKINIFDERDTSDDLLLIGRSKNTFNEGGKSAKKIRCVDEMLLMQSKLENEIDVLEAKISGMEEDYIKHTKDMGNILKGWEGYISIGTKTRKSNASLAPFKSSATYTAADRLFSMAAQSNISKIRDKG